MPDVSATPIWQTVLTIVGSPVLAALTALAVKGLGDRDKIVAHVEWGEVEGPDGNPDFEPYLVVQNLTQRKVYIVEVTARHGFFRLRSTDSTVLAYDEPWDIPFPAEIDPGAIRWFILDAYYLQREAEKVGRIGNLAGRLYGRNRIVLEARTLVGAKAMAGGERALPHNFQPAWVFRPWWR